MVCSIIYITAGKDNEYYNMRVRKTLRLNVPKQLIIDSCNLQLDEPVGQGMC